MGGGYELTPCTGSAAIDWIARTHRHLPEVQGALYAVGVNLDGELVGVATCGHPARVWMDTGRVVITRCAVIAGLPGVGVNRKTGEPNPSPACTMLYGALCRASHALGYREVWTYTLPEEPGASLLAAGFADKGLTRAEEWDRPSRPRAPAVRPCRKRRWMRHFGNPIVAKKAPLPTPAHDGTHVLGDQ